MVGDQDCDMDRSDSPQKRITANLPSDLLEEAQEVTGKGITETLIEGLRLLKRSKAYERAMALKGKIRLDVDLDCLRERRR
jgi:hypothetical protein